jgi:tetratricopeptide (TPR) repeat protein
MSYALTMLGRWDEALTRLAEVPEEQLGKRAILLSPISGVLEIHLHRGQVDQARQLLGRYDELGHSADAQAQSIYQPAVAALRLVEGDHRGALAAAEQAVGARDVFGIAAQGVKFGFLHALEASRALGDEGKLNELLEIVEALPIGLRPPFLDATAHRFRAHLAGDDPGADREFTAAEAGFRALELPFYLAVAQLEHGEWLAARGRPDHAQPLLAEARDTFERLQARPWVERTDATAPGPVAEVGA